MQARWLLGLVGVAVALLTPGRARADAKADALLKDAEATLKNALTLSAEVSMKQSYMGRDLVADATIKLKKPNLALIEMTGPIARTLASDGKNMYVVFGPANQQQYQKMSPDPQGRVIQALWATQVTAFYGSPLLRPNMQTKVAGEETVEGKPCTVVEATSEQPPVTIKVYIGTDKLVHRVTQELKQPDGNVAVLDAVLKNAKLNAELADATFAYTPPATAKLYVRPELIAVGKEAPDFNLPNPRGGNLSLSDALKGRKVALVNFWFYG